METKSPAPPSSPFSNQSDGSNSSTSLNGEGQEVLHVEYISVPVVKGEDSVPDLKYTGDMNSDELDPETALKTSLNSVDGMEEKKTDVTTVFQQSVQSGQKKASPSLPRPNITTKLREEAIKQKIAEQEQMRKEAEAQSTPPPPIKINNKELDSMCQRLMSEAVTNKIRREGQRRSGDNGMEEVGIPQINKISKTLASKVPNLFTRYTELETIRKEKLKARTEERQRNEMEGVTFKPEIRPYKAGGINPAGCVRDNGKSWDEQRKKRVEQLRKEKELKELEELRGTPLISERSEKLASRYRKKKGQLPGTDFLSEMARPKMIPSPDKGTFSPNINRKSEILAKNHRIKEDTINISVVERLYNEAKKQTPSGGVAEGSHLSLDQFQADDVRDIRHCPKPYLESRKCKELCTSSTRSISIPDELSDSDELLSLLSGSARSQNAPTNQDVQARKKINLDDLYMLATDLGVSCSTLGDHHRSAVTIPPADVYNKSPYTVRPIASTKECSSALISRTSPSTINNGTLGRGGKPMPLINTVDLPEDLLDALLL